MPPITRWVYAGTFLLIGAGFLLPFWPLSVVGVALCALSGHYIFAVIAALLVDVAWGAPLGTAQYLFFPLTLFAAACALLRLWAGKYFLDRGLDNKL